MPSKQDFPAVFEKLKHILEPFAPQLVVTTDEPGNYYLATPYRDKYKKPIFFGAAIIKKNYVSFHLVPVYTCPDLLVGMSDRLKKRMQGKACFNFTTVDEHLLDELTVVTQKGFERFKKEFMT